MVDSTLDHSLPSLPTRVERFWNELRRMRRVAVSRYDLSRSPPQCWASADNELIDPSQVIYGDTDSVMINTSVIDYEEAIKIGNEFKKTINAKYRKLEIDTDAVYSRMLLQQKKKYAAIKVSADGSKSTEVKGLDQKRKEFCGLAKSTLG